MKNIKNSLYIDSNYYVESINENLFNRNPDIYSIDVGDGNIEKTNRKDPIRYLSKNFWTNSNNLIIHADTIGEKSFSVEKHNENTIILKARKNVFRNINEDGLLEDSFSVEEWKNLTTSFDNIYGNTFSDYSFKLQELVNVSEETSLENNGNFINRECIYNFYSDKYDVLTSDRTLDVRTLPDIFSLISDQKFDVRSFEENLNLSYGGIISDHLVGSLLTKKETNNEIIEYFNSVAEKYYTSDAEIVKQRIKNSNSNRILQGNVLKALREISYIPFPYYIDIKFSNKSNTKDNFIHFLSEMPQTKNELLNYLNREQNAVNSYFVYGKDIINQKFIKSYDLKSWILAGLSNQESVSNSETEFFYDSFRPYRQIEYSKVINYIKKNIKNKNRSYFDIQNPKENNEILFYKVEKRQFSQNSSALIQTFWVNPDSSSIFRLLDTQIRYGNEYFYKIYAYVLNIGTEYTYSNYYNDNLEKLNDLNAGNYKINVESKPVYQICEVEVANFSAAVHETPPTKPKISFTNVGSSIKINLLESKGSESEEYKVIDDQDFSILESVRLSQDNEEQNTVTFREINKENLELQIYKTTIKPVNYLSFQGKKYRTIKLNGNTSLNEAIVPDIKYYYTFRYLNAHGCPSNPTVVYEVELKDEEGYYYLNINTINLDAPRPTKNFKEMRRYLLLRPSIIQLKTRMADNINSLEDISVGPADHVIWDSHNKRQFIMRITSKKTNRVIEFDVGALINRKKS